jgi:hypothetical protein
MRFTERAAAALAQLPPRYRRRGFDYARLNALLQSDPESLRAAWRAALLRECSRADAAIFPRSAARGARADDEVALALCELWSCAFRKICKKLQKRLAVPALRFRADVVGSCAFKFLGSADRAALLLRAPGAEPECPVCLSGASEWLALRCGHAVCEACSRALWAPGAEARAAAATRKACPVCRAPMAAHPMFAVRATTRAARES